MKTVGISMTEIEELLELGSSGDKRTFTQLSNYEDAVEDSIVFAANEEALEEAKAGRAGLIFVPLNTPPSSDFRLLRVIDPKFTFAVVGLKMQGDPEGTIHPSAVVAAGATVGRGSSLGAGCVVEEGAEIGERCSIGSNVTIYGNVVMGNNVMVQAGAVLGAMGFGYVRGSLRGDDGRYVRFPQQGRLVIEDEVEIGANTTIDRGALGETHIGQGTKIDNQVHIGHNCRIGKNVVIAAQVGISGSCVVEDGAVLAGQVGLGDHVTIGPGVILGGAAGVFSHKRVDGPGEMFMGVPAEPLKDYLKTIARVRRLK